MIGPISSLRNSEVTDESSECLDCFNLYFTPMSFPSPFFDSAMGNKGKALGPVLQLR